VQGIAKIAAKAAPAALFTAAFFKTRLCGFTFTFGYNVVNGVLTAPLVMTDLNFY